MPLPVASLPLASLGDLKAISASLGASASGAERAFEIRRPVGLLSCGSNASPSRMAEKLVACAGSAAIGVRVATTVYVPCYGATLSHYGSIPATFSAGGGTAFPFLLITEADNLDALVASEARTGNYDLYRSLDANPWIGAEMPVYAFVCRYGALRFDGQIIPLSEFQPEPTEGASQPDIVAALIDRMGYSMSLDAFVKAVKQRPFWTEFRSRIISAYSTDVEMNGFERID